MADLKIPARKEDNQPYVEKDRYPSAYLSQDAAEAVLAQGVKIGGEYTGTVKVRIAGANQSASNDYTSLDLELLDLTLVVEPEKTEDDHAKTLFGS